MKGANPGYLNSRVAELGTEGSDPRLLHCQKCKITYPELLRLTWCQKTKVARIHAGLVLQPSLQLSAVKLMRVFLLIVAAGASVAFLFGQASHVSDLKDSVSLLAKQIENGEAKLSYDSNRWGYLSDLLNHLDINIDSQVLVFSKIGRAHV